MREHVTDYFLYRKRYVLGYSLLVAMILSVLFIAFMFVPGELRQGEVDSSIKSASLSLKSLSPDMVVDLPYHVLQRFSINLFGSTTAAIKLPSLVLALLTAIGFFFLVKLWFRSNVAIFATMLATTGTQFIFLSQDGTSSIMYSFLAVWLLLSSTMVTRKKIFATFWKVLACVLTATLLYVPLGIYLVIAVLTTMLFHPHIRYIIRRLPAFKVVLATVLGLIVISPMMYAAFVDTDVAKQLLGIPTTPVSIKDNLISLTQMILGFASEPNSYLLRPFFSLGAFMLIAVGGYKILTQKYTARSYIILVWGVLLLPLVLLNTEHITAYLIIASMYMTLGIATLIANWYKLFPRNPYARVVGLVPLGIVVVGIAISGVMRYMNNYQYNPAVLRHYSKDLTLLKNELQTLKHGSKATLIVDDKERAFYSMVAKYDDRIQVGLDGPSNPGIVIMTRTAHQSLQAKMEPTTIITNARAVDADRFYIYKNTSN